MNPKIKQLWVKALRSGKYKQCDGQLRHKSEEGVRYCCLGVLNEVCGLRSRWEGSFLGRVAAAKVGLPYEPPTGELKAQGKLAAMNDNGKSFKRIANWIENHL